MFQKNTLFLLKCKKRDVLELAAASNNIRSNNDGCIDTIMLLLCFLNVVSGTEYSKFQDGRLTFLLGLTGCSHE